MLEKYMNCGQTPPMNKIATLTAFAIFYLLTYSYSDEMLPDKNESILTLETIFSTKDFKNENFSRPRWWSEGSNYTTLQKMQDAEPEAGEHEADEDKQPAPREIHWHDAASGDSDLLVSAAQLTPKEADSPLRIDDYAFTDDRTKLLIFTDSKKVWRYKTRGDYWVLDLEDGSLKQLGGAEGGGARLMFATFSPDGKKVGYVLEHNLYVQDLESLEVTPLTTDGSDTIINATFDWVYEEELKLLNGFRWSPDSQSIAYWQLDQSGVPVVNLINNTDELYPRLIPIHYPKAGQQNPSAKVGVVSATGGDTCWVDVPGDPREHYLADLGWIKPTGQLYLQQLNRLQNTLHFMLADPQSGATKTIHSDHDDAWIDIEQELRWVRHGSHYLTLSERDGWRHLYLVSTDPDVEPLLLTDGEYDVTDIAGVDEEAGHVYFIASPHDPLRRYLYSVDLDGSDLRRITPETYKGTNGYQVSKDGKHAIHSHSTFDSPSATQVVSLPEHKVIDTLSDNEKLRDRFAKIDPIAHDFFRVDIGDGVELDGWSLKPSDFDPEKKYPVLFHVYGEPAGQVVRDRWGGRTALWHRMLAQQGTIVIAIDNRGTPSPRGREFRKSIYRQIGVLASTDQAAATRALLKERSYLDPERVAIWGWSGGGSMTLNALFRYPELYQTGISIAAVPDMRLYDTIYQERYMGLPSENEKGYHDGSPLHFAENLKGDLMLIHGTGDDNCHYQGAELLINKLIEHNKPFSMFAYPNRSHSISEGKNTSLHLFGLMTEYLRKKH
ncbi:MAG: dipeptidyl-peptidase-4 [Verrucomicrobiales bacterium]|jgi:dipeptidyl-peptidase-4